MGKLDGIVQIVDPSRPSGSRRAVGVVVVHGVADQEVGETARAVADLLECEEPIREELVRLPADDGNAGFPMTILRSSVGDAEVAVYEMYWADASRSSKSLFGMIARLFEVLVRLPRHADAELRRAEEARVRTKRMSLDVTLLRAMFGVIRLATFGVVLATMYAGIGALLALALLSLLCSDAGIGPLSAVAIVGVSAAFGIAKVLERPSWLSLFGEAQWGVAVVAATVALGVGAAAFVFSEGDHPLFVALAGLAFAAGWYRLGMALFGEIVGVKNVARGGVSEAEARWIEGSWVSVGLGSVGAWLSCWMLRGARPQSPLYAVLDVTELCFMVSCCAFVVAVFVLAATFVARLLQRIHHTWFSHEHHRHDARLRAATTTAILSHGAPIVALVLLAIPLLSAIEKAIEGTGVLEAPAPSAHFLASLEVYAKMSSPPKIIEVVAAVVRSSGTFLLLWVVAALALLLLLGIATLAPATLAAPKERPQVAAVRAWLDVGTHNFTRLAMLMLVVIAAIFTVGFYCELDAWLLGGDADVVLRTWYGPTREGLARLSGDIVLGLGVSVAGGAGLLAFPGRLRDVVAPVWPLLDIVGDIDTYLHDPSRKTISTRARRVLDHVQSAGHDRVVVVAHSQGTVIATELLRATAKDRPTRDIQLITCGSPLAHLYHRFFPHQFQWLEESALDETLRVGSWTNLAASGDVVGMTVVDTSILRDIGIDTKRDGATPAEQQVRGVTDLLVAPPTRGHTRYFRKTCGEMVEAIAAALGPSRVAPRAATVGQGRPSDPGAEVAPSSVSA